MTEKRTYGISIEAFAQLTLLSETEGGRLSPIVQGYRPSAEIGGARYEAEILKLPAPHIRPGESAEVRVRLSSGAWDDEPLKFRGAIAIGSKIPLFEGARQIGELVVNEIMRIAVE